MEAWQSIAIICNSLAILLLLVLLVSHLKEPRR